MEAILLSDLLYSKAFKRFVVILDVNSRSDNIKNTKKGGYSMTSVI